MALDKLVIEIDGNASGLTKALSTAQTKLSQFNTRMVEGNRAVNAFINTVNRGAGSVDRLAGAANNVKSAFTGLGRSINTSAASVERFGAASKAAGADVKAFASQLRGIATSFERLSGASKGATAAINSLQRRVTALGTTVSAINGNMRTFNRTIQMATAGATKGGVTINNYGKAVDGAGRAAGRSSGLFSRLHKSNITMMEGFRRSVAQITALRTLVYQGIFWFSPLIYSIIKVNAEYEKQMQLLKNLSGAQTEAAKTQYALQTRQSLINLANTNPFSLEKITEAFVRMKVSGLDPLNGSLQTLMDSIAAFGGGNEELDRSVIALQQMVGKSAVSMEELRQQLGEHIPDAMKAMAQGMGLSMADFYNAVKKGTVESVEAIRKMLAVLNTDHRGAALAMMNTWNGLLARLGTAWQNFVAKLTRDEGANSFISTLKDKVVELIEFLNTPAGVNFGLEVEHALATVVRAVSRAIEIIYEWRHVIIDVAKVFAVMWGGRLVIGTVMSVIGIFQKFSLAVRLVVGVIQIFRGTATAAAVAARLFGAGTEAAATATRALTAATSMSIGQLALMALRFGAIAAAAVAAAGAIWLVVRAMNAKSDAERNADLAKSAKEGGTFSDKDEQMGERDRLLGLKARAQAGGHYVGGGSNKVWVPDSKAQTQQYWDLYNQGAHAYNSKLANTKAAATSSAQMHYTDQYTRDDPYAKTRAAFNDKLANETDGKKTQDLRIQENQQLAKDAQADIARLQAARSKASDPDEQAALDKLIEQRIGDRDSYLAGAKAIGEPNKFVDNGKGKKKKGAKEKRDPLDKYRTRFENEYVQSAQLEHDYNDLVNGTDTVFDEEAAQAEAEKIAAQQKDEASLKHLIAAEHERQAELKKSMEVQKAIIALQDERADTDAKTAEAVDYLKTNYESINLESKHYQESLEREYRKELAIIESRMASGKATMDNVRQYVQLKEAINAAVRAKQAELVVDAAKQAKEANEQYDAQFRTGRGQADYEDSLEYAKYNEALQTALQLASKAKQVDEELAEAKAKLEAAQRAETSAENDAIIISTKRVIADDEATKAAIASIPYLERRLAILQQEKAIRDKWGGMGGPLFDWANSAAKDFKDLGASMGGVLTGAMDDFINSLAEGKYAFADFVKSVLKGLILIIIRGLIAKAIMTALGLPGGFGGGGGFSGDFSSVGVNMSGATDFSGSFGAVGGMHSGGMVGGTPTFARSVDAGMFAFAQRYHTGGIAGLRDDEVPIIAQKGEGIFTKEQMKAMGQPQPNNVQINVINESGTPVEAERGDSRFDGEKWVETLILKKMSQPGPVREGLKALTKRN